MSKHPLIFLMLALFGMFSTAQAGELGRLFYTPQQRQQLDLHLPSDSGEEAVIRDSIVVNGVVQRKGGNRTVWINGKAQAAESNNGKAPSSAAVIVPGKTQPVQLKVGQRILLDAPAPDDNK